MDTGKRTNALPLHKLLHERYDIGDVLGKGGFGITYSAWDTRDKRRFAVKELFPNRAVSRLPDQCTIRVTDGWEDYFQHVSQRFTEEANILIKFQNNPGIISVYDLFSENNTLYYVMEYLEGMDLKEHLLKTGKMSWNQMAPILRQILPTLGLLHNVNLIHRDISPDNIFLTRDGQARLIDFGSVRRYQGTRHFTTFLKENFSPLEQYQTNGEQGPWTDIYSLCATVYYSLTGILPPVATGRISNDTILPLGELCPELSPDIAAAIHKGMAVNIQDRYSDVGQLDRAFFSERPAPQAQFSLVCRGGYYQGSQWLMSANSHLRIGRQPYCEVQYPPGMTHISGSHCTVVVNADGSILVRDDNSTNGTWLENTQLRGGIWYKAARGCRIRFAQEEYLIQ